MGGLARRVSYIKAFKMRSNLEVPALFVDAGNLFTDDRFAADRTPAEGMTKNKWVVKGHGDFHHDAANVNYNDLPYVAELFKKEGFNKRVEEYPFIERLVSANIQPADDSLRAPNPYVIREITLKRAVPGKTIRVGIVGFTEAKPTAMNQREFLYGGYRILDPFEAARKVLPELKQKADYIIALAYMPQDMAQRLASENSEIDTLIAARQINAQNPLDHFNRATIAYAYNQTKFLGEMRVYLRGDGGVENQVNRFIALDADSPDDPDAFEAVTTAHNEFTNEQRPSMESAAPPVTQVADNSAYIGASTCAGCHADQDAAWEKTGQ